MAWYLRPCHFSPVLSPIMEEEEEESHNFSRNLEQETKRENVVGESDSVALQAFADAEVWSKEVNVSMSPISISSEEEEDGSYASSSSVSSTGDRQPQSVHLKPRQRASIHPAPAAAGSSSSSHGSSDDVDSFGVYEGRWSGRRKRPVEEDVEDVVLKSPAHILCAQEVENKAIGAPKIPLSSPAHILCAPEVENKAIGAPKIQQIPLKRYKRIATAGDEICSRGRCESSVIQERMSGGGGAIGRVAQNPRCSVQGQDEEIAHGRVTNPCGPPCLAKAHASTSSHGCGDGASSHGCGDGAHASPDSEESPRDWATTRHFMSWLARHDPRPCTRGIHGGIQHPALPNCVFLCGSGGGSLSSAFGN